MPVSYSSNMHTKQTHDGMHPDDDVVGTSPSQCQRATAVTCIHSKTFNVFTDNVMQPNDDVVSTSPSASELQQ